MQQQHTLPAAPQGGVQVKFDVYTDLGEVENRWRYPTHLAIGPKGQLAIRHMTPGKLGEIGDVPIRTMDGVAVLSPRYKAAGWVLYEDLCHGRAIDIHTGERIEGDLQAWENWQTLIGLHARGQALPRGKIGTNLLHPEVERRRVTKGVPRLTANQLRDLFPGVEFDDEVEVPVD